MADIRDKSTSLLSSTLANVSSSSSSTDEGTSNRQAQALESAIYEKHNQDTGNEYRNEIRQISLDLGKNNTELGSQVASGQVDASTLVGMSNEELKSTERAAEDDNMRRQGLQESIGQGKIPVYDGFSEQQQGGSTEVTGQRLGQEGEMGLHSESMGEEGDFKARGQPKIQGLEGIEFETGM